jgi:membrane peptidoglycan carboxypeptidase
MSLSDSSLASISMGYEIGVTPMQVAAAASVIANGGYLVEPRVLRAVIRNGKREAIEPNVLRQVISSDTAATMTTIMEGVAERGTAKAAALERYQVAGKTGTAAKVVNGRYSTSDYNVSFVGFVPSRKPAFTILVVIDTPRVGPAYGGTIAAPIFKRIAEAALQQVGVAPTIHPAPPIISASNPIPAASPQEVEIVRVGGRPLMPDLRGKSLREAMRISNRLGVVMAAVGEGIVTEQSPAAGEAAEPGMSGVLHLRRQPQSDPERRGGR